MRGRRSVLPSQLSRKQAARHLVVPGIGRRSVLPPCLLGGGEPEFKRNIIVPGKLTC